MPLANFDIENLLTNAVIRVLDKGNSLCDRQPGSSVVRYHGPAYAQPNLPSTSNAAKKHDARLQIRIVAEHIVQKLERRYEERMEREMSRQRERAERRINQLREEYNMARKELMNTMEKLRQQYEQECRERLRQKEQQLTIAYSEKEATIEIERKLIQNRANELWMNKEQFDKMKDQFRLKMEKDLELLGLEREKLEMMPCRCGKIREFRRIYREDDVLNAEQEISAQEKLWKFELDIRQKEDELRRAEDSRRADELMWEKERQRMNREIEQVKNDHGDELKRKEDVWRRRMESFEQQNEELLKERSRMSNKISELETELEQVSKQLKTTQKTLLGESRERRKRGRTAIYHRPVSPSSTSLSDDEFNLVQIKTRIHAIDEMAKEMDRMIDNLDIRNEPEEIVKFENREIRTVSSSPKQERSERSSQRAIERGPTTNKPDDKSHKTVSEMSPQVSSTQEERKEEPKQETALDAYLSMIKKSNEASDFHRRRKEVTALEMEPDTGQEVKLDRPEDQNDDYSW
ncbi:hypothetical protein WR25_16695 [Diploscapter pachys]|uniref:Uncharacterized protein n=1 Tax=Diploscapter pachys TaxID=2018661 RepID=A0A2A2LU63_9BILA|nr:hypothetical protein WR25_16695 [Diploscapter pachys]